MVRVGMSNSPTIWRGNSTRGKIPGNFAVNVSATKQFQPKAFLASHSSMFLDLYHNVSSRNSVRKLAQTFQRGWGMEMTCWKVQVAVSNTTGTFSIIFLFSVSHLLKTLKRDLQMPFKRLKVKPKFTLLKVLGGKNTKSSNLSNNTDHKESNSKTIA